MSNGPNSSYRIVGKVAVSPGSGGQQSIHIEWQVRDLVGRSLGTVSQKNQIPQGSLNGAWGNTARQVAAAAVDGILRLLPPAKGG